EIVWNYLNKRGIDGKSGKSGKNRNDGKKGKDSLTDNLGSLFDDETSAYRRKYDGTPKVLQGLKKGAYGKHPLYASGGDSVSAYDRSVARNNEKNLEKRSAMNVFSFIEDELMQIPNFAEEK